MKKLLIGVFGVIVLVNLIWVTNILFNLQLFESKPIHAQESQLIAPQVVVLTSPSPIPSPNIVLKQPTGYALLPPEKLALQTFNNCGPATLSMMLDYNGIEVSQQQIADQLRPFQQAQGIDDDKSVTLDELANFTSQYNLVSFKRADGDLNKLKLFLENGIPVLTITWLDEGGGFGHYRMVKGYDDKNNAIITDDSITGLNQELSDQDFLRLWQVFNYQYLIIVPPEKKDLVMAILQNDQDQQTSYQNALIRAQNESQQDPNNVFTVFNQSTSYYYLGQFDKSVQSFEQVQPRLPFRILWYQIEPILSYQKVKNYSKVFALTNWIFQNGNPSFSELYLIRGQIYLDQGEKDLAKREFQLAVYYNQNYEVAKQALAGL